MIEFKDVCFEYRSQSADQPATRAINGITEYIGEGEFVVVLGRNGSGKSTMARLMNALLLPTRGTVWVEGMDTSKDEMVWEIRKTLGMVFQNPDNQIVATTVEEDLAFAGEPRAGSGRDRGVLTKPQGMWAWRDICGILPICFQEARNSGSP